MSLDTIAIGTIRVDGNYGVSLAERSQLQALEIDLTLKVDLRKPAESDDLNDTVNYSAINKQVIKIVAGGSCRLLERLAQNVIDELFKDDRIKEASVTIRKPQRLNGATPAVTLTRSNEPFGPCRMDRR